MPLSGVINTQTAGDALNIASLATSRAVDDRAKTVDTIQKMREAREWASKEQKAMRSSQVKAQTAASEKSSLVDQLETDWISNNVDVYQDAVASGVFAKSAEGWSKVSEAQSDAFYRYGAETDFNDSEQAFEFIKNMSKDPVGRQMIPRLPNARAVLQGDPEALNSLKVLQGSLFQDIKHRQAMAQATHKGGIEQGLQTDRQTHATGERLGAQGWKGGENALDRALEVWKANLSAQSGGKSPSLSQLTPSVPDIKSWIAPSVDAILERDGINVPEKERPALYVLVGQTALDLAQAQRAAGQGSTSEQNLGLATQLVLQQGGLKENNNLFGTTHSPRLPGEMQQDREAAQRASAKQMDDEMSATLQGRERSTQRSANENPYKTGRAFGTRSEKKFRESQMDLELRRAHRLGDQGIISDIYAKYRTIEDFAVQMKRDSSEFRRMSPEEQFQELEDLYNNMP